MTSENPRKYKYYIINNNKRIHKLTQEQQQIESRKVKDDKLWMDICLEKRRIYFAGTGWKGMIENINQPTILKL